MAKEQRQRPDKYRRGPYDPSFVSTGSPPSKTFRIKEEPGSVSEDLSAISTANSGSTSAHIKAESDSWRDWSRTLKPEDLKTENTGFRFEPPLTADSRIFHELPRSDAESRQSLPEDKKTVPPLNPEYWWHDGNMHFKGQELIAEYTYSECIQWGPCTRKDACQQFAPCQQFAAKERLKAQQESAARRQ